MSSVTITIDGRTTSVPSGQMILQAARGLDISIPTLCHLEGAELFTSCMVCVVLESISGRLLPSCSAPAIEGMRIETDGPRVREARKDALDFLLSEVDYATVTLSPTGWAFIQDNQATNKQRFYRVRLGL